jgi:hypothetical protein
MLGSNFNPISKPKRIAHAVPNAPAQRPRGPLPLKSSPVDHKIRNNVLNKFIDKLLTSNIAKQQAYERALETERGIAEISSTKPVYLSKAASTLRSLLNQNIAETPIPKKRVLKQDTLSQFWDKLDKFLLTQLELQENGFPYLNEFNEISFDLTHKSNARNKCTSLHLKNKPYGHICRRCGKEFVLHLNYTQASTPRIKYWYLFCLKRLFF